MAETGTKRETERVPPRRDKDLSRDARLTKLPPGTRRWLMDFVGAIHTDFEVDAEEYLRLSEEG